MCSSRSNGAHQMTAESED